ncbi:hypothetical protein OIDMADRAFT_62494 [Oidiodendron maius Zn]|uniref:Uncharacterized protein n=1 Tax=Oidiodendron maius (strain Zn) TaxID=913774 RepID=A0A0C3G8J0_OIDMZ|nr:hypothetical protein OIDMADRAFT_62494 [Oidiodendron maius Zn]
MSTLTIREYIPKVPNTITHKLPPKPCWTIPGKESAKPSAKAAEDNEWRKKPATVSELMSQENALFNTEKAHGQITRRENSEDDDNDLLKRHRARFNRKSPEEGSQESRAGSKSDEPIELDSDSKRDLDEDLQTTHIPYNQSGRQQDHEALDLETLSELPDRSADEPNNDVNSPDINTFSGDAKRVRFASPCQVLNLGLSTPPYSCDGDGKRNMTDPESDNSDSSQDSTISPTWQKFPASQHVEIGLNGHNGQLEHSRSVVSRDDEFDGLGNSSDDSNSSSASLSTPAAPDSLGVSRICPQFVDINQHWEYRKIIGEEDVDGVPCYEMDWCPSLIPKSEVKNEDVVAEYETRKARARERCGPKRKRKARPNLKHCGRIAGDVNTVGQPQKRLRGRPRKVQPANICDGN